MFTKGNKCGIDKGFEVYDKIYFVTPVSGYL